MGREDQLPRTKDSECSFAVVALDKDTLQEVATLRGSIQGTQTVPRAEATALLYLLKYTTGAVESSIDAQAILKRLRKLPQPKATSNMDLWRPLSTHKHHRGQQTVLHWVNSHQTLEHFQANNPDLPPWIRWTNHKAVAAAEQYATHLAEELNLANKVWAAEWVDGRQYKIQQRLKFWLGQKEEVPGLAKPLNPHSNPKLPTRKELIEHLHTTHTQHLWGTIDQKLHGPERSCNRCHIRVLSYWTNTKANRVAQAPCHTHGNDYPTVHPSHDLGWTGTRHRCKHCRNQATTGQLILKDSWLKPCPRQKGKNSF